MSQRRNIPCSVANRYFYDAPEAIPDTDGLLVVARWEAPPHWSKRPIGLYYSLRPTECVLPEQGWKIHISSTPDRAEHVAQLIWRYCVEHQIAFKFLRSIEAVLQNNSKYWPRTASGKFCTIYPCQDQFEQSVLDLNDILSDQPGPYILGDIRYALGPVFARYGAFSYLVFVNEHGEQVPAIRDPTGRLVPDYRDTVATVPDFVQVPAFLQPFIDPSPSLGDLPFEIGQRIHVSNGGGIYEGRRKEDGAAVVLREARPHAGLDNNRNDAIHRLRNERAVLARLEGLDCVPHLYELHQIWEHEFLVTEFVAGRTLLTEIIHRYPYVHPSPSTEQTCDYLDWVRQTFARIKVAVAMVHARGVRLVDLHPGNIMVKPDGGIVLIDFECAQIEGERAARALGALGFSDGVQTSGQFAGEDNLALSRILLMMLLPIVPMLGLKADHASVLVKVAKSLFMVDADLAGSLLPPRAISVTRDGSVGELIQINQNSWATFRSWLIASILSRATSARDDIIFRCDALQFSYGAASFGYGASGIIYAIHQAGGQVSSDLLDRTFALATHGDGCKGLGFYDGLHGVAFALQSVGRDSLASKVLDTALGRPLPRSPGLFSGLAGVTLNLLHFSEIRRSKALREKATRLASNLLESYSERSSFERLPPGLMHGASGLALLFLRLYEKMGLSAYLDAAEEALWSELGLGQLLSDGAFHLVKSPKYLIYLDEGSIGLGLVLDRFIRHRKNTRFTEVLGQIRNGCSIPFVMQPGLFQGRAGLVLALAVSPSAEDHAIGLTQAGRLSWHAVRHGDQLAFPGNGLIKFTDDLASGSSGILLALNSLFGIHRTGLPFLNN